MPPFGSDEAGESLTAHNGPREEAATPVVQDAVTSLPGQIPGTLDGSVLPSKPLAAGPRPHATLECMPKYARSLLRIQVPVIVTLAKKRQALSRIMELGPGSLIQFDKSCEAPLELRIGGHPVAVGEAVKVGEKFGLRVNAMVLPGERFRRVQGSGFGVQDGATVQRDDSGLEGNPEP